MEYSVLGFGHCIGSSDVIMQFFPEKVVQGRHKKHFEGSFARLPLLFISLLPLI